MPWKFMAILIFLIALLHANVHPVLAQSYNLSLNIADDAPPLKVDQWLKGTPFQNFKRGKIYVVEFWATWCAPCKAAIPRLSKLAKQYKNKITVLGVDVYDSKEPLEKIKKFVADMGDKMNYYVAIDKERFMETHWLEASERGIPKTIVVDANGKIAWIGHPSELEPVIITMLNGTWDLKKALDERNLMFYLTAIDDSLNIELAQFGGYGSKRQGMTIEESLVDPGQPDSALFYIKQIIEKEPLLLYAPMVTFHMLNSLLKTDTAKAIEYGRKALGTNGLTGRPTQSIEDVVEIGAFNFYIPKEMYELAARSYQFDIDEFPYPEIYNYPKYYHKMAWCYWMAKNKTKAVDAEQNAINKLKNKVGIFRNELSMYESQLEIYKNCRLDE